MNRKSLTTLIVVIYFIAGIVIAWQHHYLTLGFLKALGSVLLAILLWWLVLLGINLHIR